jgi:hypothetical protein
MWSKTFTKIFGASKPDTPSYSQAAWSNTKSFAIEVLKTTGNTNSKSIDYK